MVVSSTARNAWFHRSWWPRSTVRWAHGLLFGVLFTSSTALAADDGPSDPFDELRERIERLEQENRDLRVAMNAKVPPPQEPSVLFGLLDDDALAGEDGGGKPLEDGAGNEQDEQIGSIVQKYLRQARKADEEREKTMGTKIASLEKNYSTLNDKVTKKTYPNFTINGVFQADTGFFQQNQNSHQTYNGIGTGPAGSDHGFANSIPMGSDFRRARLSAKGGVTETMNYFFQMDFGFNGRPTFTDVWVEQTKVPYFGTVRAGQWKQPFSLEVVSSFRYTTFMERSVLFNLFTPFRHIGTGFYDVNDDQTMTWAASVFRTGQDQFGNSVSQKNGWGIAERLTALPFYENDGRDYLHFGFGHFFNAPPNNQINFRTVPDFFVGDQAPAADGSIGSSPPPGQTVPGNYRGTPFVVATGNINSPHYNVFGTELLWVRGPLSIQSEGMLTIVQQAPGVANAGASGLPAAVGGAPGSAQVSAIPGTQASPNLFFPGCYAQAGYFLTGEHRPYDRKTATIDRIIPRRNIGPWCYCGDCCEPGWGAWELAGRFDWADLNSGNIQGGTVTQSTVGVNWYVNPYCKVVFNWVHSMTDTYGVYNGSGTNPVFQAPNAVAGGAPGIFTSHYNLTDIYGMRVQVDF